MPLKNLRDAILRVQDNTAGTPNEIQIMFSEGDLKFSVKDEIKNILDRGELAEMKRGPEAPIEGSFSKKFEELSKQVNAVAPTFFEVVTHTGGAAHWVSTNSATGVYSLRLIFDLYEEVPGRQNERIIFEKCHFTKIDFEENEEADKESYEFTDFEVRPTVVKF